MLIIRKFRKSTLGYASYLHEQRLLALRKVVLAESMVPHLPELAPAAKPNLSELIFVKRTVFYLFEARRKRNFFKRTLGKTPFPDMS